jgi:hypothetical protein
MSIRDGNVREPVYTTPKQEADSAKEPRKASLKIAWPSPPILDTTTSNQVTFAILRQI